jgi:hypothetical protein
MTENSKTLADRLSECRALTETELDLVGGAMTNAETPLGAAFIQGFLDGGGCLGAWAGNTHIMVCKK